MPPTSHVLHVLDCACLQYLSGSLNQSAESRGLQQRRAMRRSTHPDHSLDRRLPLWDMFLWPVKSMRTTNDSGSFVAPPFSIISNNVVPVRLTLPMLFLPRLSLALVVETKDCASMGSSCSLTSYHRCQDPPNPPVCESEDRPGLSVENTLCPPRTPSNPLSRNHVGVPCQSFDKSRLGDSVICRGIMICAFGVLRA